MITDGFQGIILQLCGLKSAILWKVSTGLCMLLVDINILFGIRIQFTFENKTWLQNKKSTTVLACLNMK